MSTKTSFSQALLAVAIGALALSIFKFTAHLPEVLQIIEKTSKTVDLVTPQIEVIIDEVALVRAEISKVRAVVDEQTPAILAEVKATRPVVREVVQESKNYSQQLPALLKQIESLEQQIASIQEQLPAVFNSIDSLVGGANNLTTEISLWRPHSSQYLKEVELSREYVPQYLTRMEYIVEDAKTVGSEASQGVVSGFFKGVITLPFKVVSGLAGIVDIDSKSAKYLTAADVTLMQAKVIELLNDDEQKTSLWSNDKSGNYGTIKKGDQQTQDHQKCHKLTFNNHFGNEKEKLRELMCLNNEGIWKVM